ncbi:hypothetical protein AvCA_44440 [Azotobacter vinelandii CA]|uniref:Aminoglycoside phosphotransferase domain-containing protein n=2 Tax=Azotobacter vinelandii TaxID=354 RepID=C1DGR6_AZOVD|nr:phosphotransferase [Azotobacter vinelandii]ACO80562.1 hypothetical protein Avin_44440 [Azotobacter vinelandii DJ]AGK15949.1 hypothetical protein AvCA_44440 [Azotobacter vinelandii CA]AGK22012.1 hypothetical protein AvCA6_44440 [Azotobacter vinelandii CA6]WKN21323.1 phosphotransferase [Azotobacter vinelandii]SFX37214.1 Phosphotransferase enzyme family protein [Azotobacter vinelandii]
MRFHAEGFGAGWPRPHFLGARFSGPLVFSGSGWRWWLADEAAQVPARLLDRFLQDGDPAGITLLRERAEKHKSRRIYRLQPPESPDSPGYFVKQMALTPRKRLGALLGCSSPLVGVSHGTAELAHNLALNERTVHGVGTFAFGEYFRCGLPVQQILLQEYLAGWQAFSDVWLAHEDDAARRRTLLRQLMEVLTALRGAGICHLDLHPGNVMVSPEPRAPLRVIDCGQMAMGTDAALSTALHLGVFLHELNGKRSAPSPRLAQAACRLLRRLIGDEASLADAERLLPLLIDHSTKKPFSRRRLLERRAALDPAGLERRLQELARNRPSSHLASETPDLGERRERRLIASIEDMLATPD